MSKEVADVLRAAKALIGVPERWTKNKEARDAKGRETSPFSENAVCWCSAGALMRVTPNTSLPVRYRRGAEAMLDSEAPKTRSFSRGPYIAFNDRRTTTHADIMALFDRAIAAAEAP